MEKNIKIGDKVYSITSDDNYLEAMGDDFEPHMVQLFRTLIGKDDVVADIGANIGLTAILFSSLAHKVFAFEPSSTTYNLLSANISKAGASNVEIINLGLGQKIESLTITFASNNRSGGYVSDKIRPDAGHVTEKIQIDTLDHYFSNKEAVPSFLKIDVEGFEQNVIKGGRAFLDKNKPVAVMEMNHFCLDVLQRITIPDFLDFMRSVFPCLYAVDTDNSTIVDLHDPDSAYSVMHAHVVSQRFPNIVGGFDHSIKTKLDTLAANSTNVVSSFTTPWVAQPGGLIEAEKIPGTASIGEVLEIPVTLTNAGDEAWYGYGTHPVLLSYHWQNADGSHQIYDGVRTRLKCQVVSTGSTVKEAISVVVPRVKGNFKLILTVVQEGVCWFEDKGFECATASITVV